MPEAFKNWFNEPLIRTMADHFHRHETAFDAEGFVGVATNNLEALELKARSAQITEALRQFLPNNFEEAARVLLASLGKPLKDDLSAGVVDEQGISGWGVMPMADYVALYGQEHFDVAMQLLKAMTQCFSSEFAIRAFLQQSQSATLVVLHTWALDKSKHVRRLVSEGSRPRLPWAMNLPAFIQNPSPVIELLERLKDDDSEYVRRSVANNLNDIAKDHPDLVAEIARKWLQDGTSERKKMIRHACRTLIKQGHKTTLATLGYGPPKLCSVTLNLSHKQVCLGEALFLDVTLRSDSKQEQALMVDYIVHHQKANGTTTPKVFKWKAVNLAPNEALTARKKHNIKPITTRVYYPGVHHVEVVINGVSMAKKSFELLLETGNQ